MHTRTRDRWDNAVFGGMAGITILLILSCIAHYFDVGSMRTALDRFMS